MTEAELRAEIVATARALDAAGLNRGASGNLSARCGDALLITPSAVPYDELTPDMLARMPLEGDYGAWEGPRKPSSEWRFHLDLLRARPDLGAVVHTHAPWSTVLAVARRPIPAIHYMIAAFGGPVIRVADYACYGTAELSAAVLHAMEGRLGCLMANHGMLTAAPTLARAAWLAHELEALAHQHYHALLIGGGHVLTEAELAEVAQGFAGYGVAAG
ncbi:MAG: class II aldolase/adducin family protein [Roseovarius sp.]|nr:class II aldolase/adducin family protein [Roseovarius sp.]